MPQQRIPGEFNSFVGGLITEASPLTFPENASLDEDNMILNVDGSRNRRLGMDYEASASTITTTVTQAVDTNLAITTFNWENAGGEEDKELVVVQVGNELKFFDLDNTTISSGVVHTEKLSSASKLTPFNYASVDGTLVVTTGVKEISLFEYSAGTITLTEKSLLIRDFFGVEDTFNGENLTAGTGVATRPSSLSDGHLYNLRNQSFGEPHYNGNTETLTDPITAFTGASKNSSNLYPSNSDNVPYALYADANDTNDRTVERFFANDLFVNPQGTTQAPKGHFIIDALERGASRIAEEVASRGRYSSLTHTITSLPTDKTPGGATVVTEFSGRAWFAGFPGDIEDGDAHSPRLASYILFSKVVDDIADITQCYQDGDPTSSEAPDLVDTDGGYIRIEGAYGIKGLVNVGSNLIIIAANGVWRIVGGSDFGFTATQYIVEKLTDRGCPSAGSIVPVDKSVMFWGDDGIYHVRTNQFGDWVAENVTSKRIQTLYENIPSTQKQFAKGFYDTFDRKVRWVYDNLINDATDSKELILDIELNAFYTNTIFIPGSNKYPKVVDLFKTKPFQISVNTDDVEVNTDIVQVNGEDVQVTAGVRNAVTREVYYLAITADDPVVTYTFSVYKDTNFIDWVSFDDVGTDAAAYLVTGYFPGQDFQRKKQAAYVHVHLKRTETGFDSNFNLLGESSCLMQAQWDWVNSANANRYGTQVQTYRYRRLYFPENSDDTYDTGHSVITTRNKVRGQGKVLSLRFDTEPRKNFHLYGWSFILAINSNV